MMHLPNNKRNNANDIGVHQKTLMLYQKFAFMCFFNVPTRKLYPLKRQIAYYLTYYKTNNHRNVFIFEKEHRMIKIQYDVGR